MVEASGLRVDFLANAAGSKEGFGRLGTSKRPWTAMGDGAPR